MLPSPKNSRIDCWTWCTTTSRCFLIHNEDLGSCNKLAHTIPTVTGRPVYLPHRTILWQYKVKCKNAQNLAKAGHNLTIKKSLCLPSGNCMQENWWDSLCVNCCKLDSIVVRDAFPLPHIDEALQTVHNCQWFSPLNLVQGYLQMPIAEVNIDKELDHQDCMKSQECPSVCLIQDPIFATWWRCV